MVCDHVRLLTTRTTDQDIEKRKKNDSKTPDKTTNDKVIMNNHRTSNLL
jgi:hypothetical protein